MKSQPLSISTSTLLSPAPPPPTDMIVLGRPSNCVSFVCNLGYVINNISQTIDKFITLYRLYLYFQTYLQADLYLVFVFTYQLHTHTYVWVFIYIYIYICVCVCVLCVCVLCIMLMCECVCVWLISLFSICSLLYIIHASN